MPKSNRQRVEEALDFVAAGFGPFVAGELGRIYGDSWPSKAAERGGWGREKGNSVPNPQDPDFILWVTINHWQNPFRKVLGQQERNYVGELRDARHRWAHKEAFTADATHRVLDTAYLLLSAVGAPEAAAIDNFRQEALRIRFEEMTKRAASAPLPGLATVAPSAGLRAWREVIEPHDDVATGRYQQAEFAADLAQVYRGGGLPEYSQPEEFFRRTFLTRGLRTLLVQTIRRLSSQGGEPVIDLLTNFGGGKTHSLLAVFHLAGAGVQPATLPGLEELASEAGVQQFPVEVTRAVLVGTALSPHRLVEKPDGTIVRTFWGEMAWQLGGPDGYELVASEDEARVDPGSEVLRRLLERFAPAVILIDEWVAYARQLWARDDLLAGTFDVQMSFAQSLTEAVRAVPNAMLLISIPASDRFSDSEDSAVAVDAGIEVGGVGGLEALKRLRNVIHRADSPWQPATAEEGFEIVRRRLFKPLDAAGYGDRDSTARQLMEMYRRNGAEFPSDCRESVYEDRMKRAYPIHPELFDRLYQDWATLERFQRTRGVLRLMAAVIHALWAGGDQSPLIMPASVPLDDQSVLDEVTRHLEDNWKPVIDTDIDGSGSVPAMLDRDVPALGRLQATRRVARAVFIGSAPTLQRHGSDGGVVQNPNRGIEDLRVKLGCVFPGEGTAVFGDALRRLSDRATHLYVDGSRYWYSTTPSVARMAQDIADGYGDDVAYEALVQRIRQEADLGDFARIHRCPLSATEVDDEPRVGLVVLRPEYPHAARQISSPALAVATEVVGQRQGGPRVCKNMLLFLAPDQNQLTSLLTAVRLHKAWQHIYDRRAELNLDQFGVTQSETKRDTLASTVRDRISETYVWLLVPAQAPTDDDLHIEAVKINGQGSLAERASRKAVRDGALNIVYGSSNLRLELDRIPLWRSDHVGVKQAWEDFTRYLYLPRLKDDSVFLAAVATGPLTTALELDGFGYAESFDENANRYRALIVHATATGAVADGNSMLVKPQVALAQRETEQREHEMDGLTKAGSIQGPSPMQTTRVQDRVAPTRFFGRVSVDPLRLGRDAAQIATEVVNHLAALPGAELSVTIEIQASGSGYDEATQRVVTENGRALGFDAVEFE